MAIMQTNGVKMDIQPNAAPKQRFGAVGWLLVAISLVLVIVAVLTFNEVSTLNENNEILQESLFEERAKLQLVGDAKYDTQYIRQMMYSAKEAGTAVSDAINAAHTIEWNAADAGQQPDWDAVRAELAHVPDYFPSAYENGASWYAERNPKDGDRSEWSFMTTFVFSHDTIHCLWLCRRQSDGQIMAYVTATYEASLGTFQDFDFSNSHHITTYGNAWQSEINDAYFENIPSGSDESDEESSDTSSGEGVMTSEPIAEKTSDVEFEATNEAEEDV